MLRSSITRQYDKSVSNFILHLFIYLVGGDGGYAMAGMWKSELVGIGSFLSCKFWGLNSAPQSG